MATLATFFRRSDAIPAEGRKVAAVRAQTDPFRLRALPNDDIYFFSKRIDNSRVVRQADPSARGECWSAVGAAAILMMIGGSLIAPHVASILTGYKLESLKQERQALVDQRRALDVQEAALLAPSRLNELARERSLATPGRDQVIHLDNVSLDQSFAKNQPPRAEAAIRR